jgi:hypothetical protein
MEWNGSSDSFFLSVPRRVFSETTTSALDLIFCGLRFIHSSDDDLFFFSRRRTDGRTERRVFFNSNHPTNDRSIDRSIDRRIFYCVLGIIDSFQSAPRVR